MRFQIGQVVPFISMAFEANSETILQLGFAPLYLPWEHKLKSLSISLMRCDEHHKVPDEFSSAPDHDGYVFRKTSGDQTERWLNQYPVWRGSQTSSLDDTLFLDMPENADPDDSVIYAMGDARSYLLGLYRGVRQVAEQDQERSNMLQAHYDRIVFLLKESGVEVEIKPSDLHLKYYVQMNLVVSPPL